MIDDDIEIPDLNDFGRMLLMAGRNKGPRILFEWWPYYGDDLMRNHILDVWEMAEYPTGYISERRWKRAFRAIGFVSDPPGLDAPTEPITVYRGCSPVDKRGMSWTTNLETARWFRNRYQLVSDANGWLSCEVYQMEVPPSQVLAMINPTEGNRGEAEVIIDCVGIPRSAIKSIS